MNGILLRGTAALAAAGLGWLTVAGNPAAAAEVGAGFDVAPNVEKTRLQHWPRAAWAEKSKCWLVVWREGDLNEQETDVWCTRVGADGKALDPAGIRIAGAKDVQDRPVVASDGKDFLVAWQDLRGGKDWDVYAARVSGDGKVLTPDGFVVDARPQNQCMPSLAFTGTNYLLAWEAWVEDALTPGYGSYEVRGARLSADGKVLDAGGTQLAAATAMQPALASHAEGGLAMVCIGRTGKKINNFALFGNNPLFLRIAPDKGAPQGAARVVPTAGKYTWDQNYVPGVVMMKDGTVLVTMRGYKGSMTLFRLDREGQLAGEPRNFRVNIGNEAIVPMSSISYDGKKALMTYDFPTDREELGGRPPLRMKVWGWMLSPEGAVVEGGKSGFLIAGGENVDCMQGVPCAGPDGTFLVVCSEVRAVEDTKIVGRLVK